MHFKIIRSLLPHCEPRYLHCITEMRDGSKSHTVCILGQILEQLGNKLFVKVKGEWKPIRTPSELKSPCPPFTRSVRGMNVLSDLAITIMQVPYPPSREDIERLGPLLAPWKHTIEYVDDLTLPPKE